MAIPRARFGGIDVISNDMAKSLAFYRELGLEIPDDQVWFVDGVPHHVDLHFDGESGVDIDSARMTTLYDPAWAASAAAGAAVVLLFRTDTRNDVDALHDHMIGLGHPSHLAPFDAFWGARYAVIIDPDGNHVSLMSPLDPATAGPPPAV
jgi:catechol 2,3-dioxygenase-like lactoylglutathione lyase family enzyme